MIELKKLSPAFEKANPDIKLKWVILEENVLRQRATTDITTGSGQFDVMTIGAYEAPQWGKRGWLAPLTNLPADYDLNDVVKTARDGLSYNGTLYALPFYVESSMTYLPQGPVRGEGPQDARPADLRPDRAIRRQAHRQGQRACTASACAARRAGARTWRTCTTRREHLRRPLVRREVERAARPRRNGRRRSSFYVDLLKKDGPPGASSNGFNENLTLMSSGKCAMWIDATVAAGMLYNKQQSQVADKIGFAAAPVEVTPKGSHWLWAWALAIPKTSKQQDAAKKFITWATWQAVHRTGREGRRLGVGAAGHAQIDLCAPRVQAGRAVRRLRAEGDRDGGSEAIRRSSRCRTRGMQFVGIPEFQSFGTVVGQSISGAVAGQMTVDQALAAGNAAADRAVQQAGYQK